MQRWLLLIPLTLLLGCGDRADMSGAQFSIRTLEELLVSDLDRDGDGISDEAEKAQYGTNPENPDSDGDNLSDSEEVGKFNTNPLSADSDGDNLSDSDEVHNYNTNPNLIDSDEDNLSDYSELFVEKTNPLMRDSDEDNLSDYQERKIYDTNALVADSDGDGLSDGEEVLLYNTKPLNIDSENDGLHDGEEILSYHTDPLNYDTDGDNLNDRDEVFVYRSDPLLSDSDNDGLSDGDEVSIQTNLLNSDSDGDGVLDAKEVFDFNGSIAKPANTRPSTYTIDALDPLNDSDGDLRLNLYETQKGTDPLDANSFYPWIYESTLGQTLSDSGLVYVVGGFDVDGENKEGFWLSKYKAKASEHPLTLNITNIKEYVANNFNLYNSATTRFDATLCSGEQNETCVANDYSTTEQNVASGLPLSVPVFVENGATLSGFAYEASFMLAKVLVQTTLSLPSDTNYMQLIKIIINNSENYLDNALKNGGSFVVANGVMAVDANVPEHYSTTLYEFNALEWTSSLIASTARFEGDSFESVDAPYWWLPITKEAILPQNIGAYNYGEMPLSYINLGYGVGNKDAFACIIRGFEGVAGVDLSKGIGTADSDNIGFRGSYQE